MSEFITVDVTNVEPVYIGVPPVGALYHLYMGFVIEPAVSSEAVMIASLPRQALKVAPCECALLLNSINNKTASIIKYIFLFIAV